MENMTRQMHKIAVKTEKETVSMRIITLVTLFFLPGTFVSVSLDFLFSEVLLIGIQTLMSTDIIQFSSNQRTFSSAATKTYIGITLPFMFFTFLSAYLYYHCVKRTENLECLESDEDPEQGEFS